MSVAFGKRHVSRRRRFLARVNTGQVSKVSGARNVVAYAVTGGTDDEQLAIALAAAAGAAIANARRFAESEQRRRWLDAAAELTPLLLSGAAVQPHALITQLAAAAADADFPTLAVPHGADQVMVAGVAGELAAGMMIQVEALADSLAGQTILTGKPSLVTGDGRQAAAAALSVDTGPLIVVPWRPASRPGGPCCWAGWPPARDSSRQTWAWPPPSPATPR